MHIWAIKISLMKNRVRLCWPFAYHLHWTACKGNECCFGGEWICDSAGSNWCWSTDLCHVTMWPLTYDHVTWPWHITMWHDLWQCNHVTWPLTYDHVIWPLTHSWCCSANLWPCHSAEAGVAVPTVVGVFHKACQDALVADGAPLWLPVSYANYPNTLITHTIFLPKISRLFMSHAWHMRGAFETLGQLVLLLVMIS